jgi:hypothetical protein
MVVCVGWIGFAKGNETTVMRLRLTGHEAKFVYWDDCLPGHTAEYCAGFKFGLWWEYSARVY